MIPHLVIGGGLAGAAVAILLARRGEAVTLLEKEKEPKHKVCGEFLSIEAQHYLQALGIDPDRLGAAPIRQLRLSADTRSVESHLPFTGRSLSRHALDAALLARANASGVTVRKGADVTGLAESADGYTIKLRGGESLIARRVYLATGKHELRGWPRRKPIKPTIGFKMHWHLSPAQQARLCETAELYLLEGGYAGLEPIEDGRTNLCLAIAPDRFTALGGRWEMLLSAWREASPLLNARLTGAIPVWEKPLAVAGIPYGFVSTEAKAQNLFRLGDQMAVIPSFCGDGMAMTLHSAFLAAQAKDARAYHRQARRDFLPLVRRAVRMERLARHPLGQAALFHGQCAAWLLPRLTLATRLRQEAPGLHLPEPGVMPVAG